MMFKKLTTVLGAGVVMFGSFGLAQATPIITNGLIAAYDFNGNANDSSGNGNNGTVSGPTLTADRFGNTNSAYSFDGNNDGIFINDVNDQLAPSNLTVSTWFKFDGKFDTGSSVMIAYKGNYDPVPHMAYSLEIQKANKKLTGRSDTALSSNILSMNPVNDNKWHYTAFVINDDLNEAFLYLDGVLQNTTTLSGTVNQNIEPLSIGKYYYNNLYDFSGIIDEFYIYNRALTSSEINTLYTGTNPIPEPPTLLVFGAGIAGLACTRFKRTKYNRR